MSSPVPPARPVFRADVQGLRAVAVIAVILNHVIGWPAGGFAGVDVFFVISGFLITGLLLRDREEHGRISLRRFYAKRMRRILPAAVTVLIATSVAAYFLFNRPRAISTLWDAVSSLLFVSNWRFAAEGTDYFQATDAVSPLQHFWSLSVEEQFYLVWPWLMLLVLAVAARSVRASTNRVRIAVGTTLAVIVAASFVYALWETATSPAPAYFSTLSRVWELGVGALLAAAAPALARLPLPVRVLGGWIGLAGILSSFFVISADTPFPGPWAAFPVLATALVIAAGVGGRQRHLVPLVNPVSVFFGDLSYSLYLWHFPILVFLLVLMPQQTTTVTLLILGLTLAVSLVSYFLIEQPLHRSPWLAGAGGGTGEALAATEEGQDARDARRAAWQGWRERFGAQFILSSLGLVVIVVAVVVTAQVTLRGGPSAAAPGAPGSPGAPAAASPNDGSGAGDTAGQPAVNPEDELQAQLAEAAAATSWPGDLSPSLDDVIAAGSSTNPARACFDIGATPDFGSCTWGSGDAPNHLYLVGDSEALSYAPAFKALAEGSDGTWKVTTVGLYGCRFTDVLIQNEGAGVMDACQQRKQDVASHIVSDAPQLVVVSNAYALGKASDGRPITVGDIVASTTTETAKYGASGRLVYLAPPPLGASLGQCYSPATSPQNCNVGIDQAWQDFQSATAAAAAATGDHVVSSLPFSCANGVCPAFAGTLPTKYDSVHLTPAFAEHLAPSIRWELGALGLF
ncbi:acyltransferase [Herbiconiux sp. CPCC 205763]|uniref:Acyltransferase n=1 Tax=Herbiconiux aconitum TaxID=2970913 RepID=A0ABT2GUA6_9MICO|nr:acyltransferase family protein [Herbiconiux aconitum]MCS5719147.1 acyltransferase [Herbiconiux aconitum]